MTTNFGDSYQILINGCSGSRYINILFNLICHQSDIDKIYSYIKDLYETNYQFLINKGKVAGLMSRFWGYYWILKWYGQYSWRYWKL